MTGSAGPELMPDPELIPDPFQIEAMVHIDAGRSVLVAAPTGAGKTLVAEHAIHRVIRDRRRAFYTAPIKALSNQKYHDFVAQLGPSRVGLLTGDNVINPEADIVVMTTEVLRNMLYAGRPLDRLGVVVLDEVHYLEDSFRGPVWEEVILNLPEHVLLVCLSATVSNTDEVGGWLEAVRGPTGVVVETRRPVDLEHLYVIGDRRGDRLHVLPMFVDERPNPEGYRFDSERGSQRHGRRHRPRSPWRPPQRLDLIDLLERRDLLPVIWFVFSRNGCDEAARATSRAGVRLTTAGEASRIRAIAEERLSRLDGTDLEVLDAAGWLANLERGVSAHHAGLVPAFKEAIEECFAEGLVKVVFATETLALGVNLPARSVVIDKLSKFTGESHEQLTPGQFTQLTGRAGRRGLDQRGHAIVPWSPYTSFAQLSSLAGSRSFRLQSAFRPTYNMVANLLIRLDADAARGLLGRSFAQYQSDAEVARIEQRLVRERRRLTELRAGHEDDEPADGGGADGLGPADPDLIADAVSRLRPGDVVAAADGGPLAVLGVSWRRGGRARVRLVDPRGRDVRWDLADLAMPPDPIGHIDLPVPMAPEQAGFRHEVAGALRRSGRGRPRRPARRATGRGRDRAEQLRRLSSDVRTLERRARSAEGSVARRFDAVADVLRDRRHLDGWEVTASGRLVARIYHELDLVVAETIEAGLFDGLDPAALASLVSSFTFEQRTPGPPPPVWFPSRAARQRFEAADALAAEIRRVERRHAITESRPLDAGFATASHAWAAGEDLSALLDEDLSAGDFVRNVKQLVDLLRQIATAAPQPATRTAAATAASRLHRGVVALSGTVGA